MKTFISAFCLLICFAFLLRAQTPTGTIQGVITDPSSAVLPDAKVVITNVATNETKTLRTDATGHYIQPFLLTGTYAVTVEKEGFQTVRQDNIKLDVSQNRSVDVMLPVGPSTQSVRVEATPPPVDVNTSSVGISKTSASRICRSMGAMYSALPLWLRE
ncbi:MAG: carboxypeptidase-like regulatory domain-containing protein [Acidobacteria bacterium]|nr:carboxypeptidase-like regulatory domain-containing protein [Acidobacteriota bacterium]